jgi:hypothetical protein
LSLSSDFLVSNLAFKFNLCRYSKASMVQCNISDNEPGVWFMPEGDTFRHRDDGDNRTSSRRGGITRAGGSSIEKCTFLGNSDHAVVVAKQDHPDVRICAETVKRSERYNNPAFLLEEVEEV